MDIHRRRSGQKHLHYNVCETCEETDEEEVSARPDPNYIHQLRSILGYETAEYFLNPPPMDFRISSSLQRIMDGMEDSLGAEQLWKILQEKSQPHLRESHGDFTSTDKDTILSTLSQRPGMRRASRKQKHLLLIRQVSQRHQDQASLMLANKRFPDMNDCRGEQGYTRYLTETLKKGP